MILKNILRSLLSTILYLIIILFMAYFIQSLLPINFFMSVYILAVILLIKGYFLLPPQKTASYHLILHSNESIFHKRNSVELIQYGIILMIILLFVYL